MKRRPHISKKTAAAAVAIILVAWLVIRRQSLSGEAAAAGPADADTIPTMVTRNSTIVHTDSGYPRYHATAEVYYSFDNAPEPYWRFDKGAFIEQLDNDRNVVATLQCDSAVYARNSQIWDCIGNVRINNAAGDRFLTQRMLYDVRAQKIRSDSFIHIEKSDKIIEGYGFESNAAITDYTVNRPTMMIPVSDFNRANPTGTAAISDATPPSAPNEPVSSSAVTTRGHKAPKTVQTAQDCLPLQLNSNPNPTK